MSFTRNEDQLTEELMKVKIDLLRQLTEEKCRKHRISWFNTSVSRYNYSEAECTNASKNAAAALQELYQLKFGAK